MKQITHEQAQTYLQFAADQSLGADEMAALDAHLLNCAVCRGYAEEFARVEASLRSALRRRWDSVPVRVPMDRILGRVTVSPLRRALSVAATPILLTVLILLAVTLTRGTISGGSDTATPLATVMATTIPTPSVSQGRTNTVAVPSSSTIHAATTTNECEWVRYVVQPGDTLTSIAEKFGVSMEAILEVNPFPDGDSLSMVLTIPVCNPTPGNTLTYTPPFTPTSYTP